MHWMTVPGIVQVAVHTSEQPTDDEWDRYLESVVAAAETIKGILVYSAKTGPTASQRARSVKAFEGSGAKLKTAIMTGSRLTQGAVTALSWALGTNIRAFSTLDFDKAAAFLDLTREDQISARVALKQLGRAADIEIDAFADESGKFRQRFS